MKYLPTITINLSHNATTYSSPMELYGIYFHAWPLGGSNGFNRFNVSKSVKNSTSGISSKVVLPPQCRSTVMINLQEYPPWKINGWNISSWRFGSDDFPFQIGDLEVPAVNPAISSPEKFPWKIRVETRNHH